jgi:hypothetical protein
MDEEKRSSSEILLSLEEKVDTLIKYYQNVDYSQKVILGQINSLKMQFEAAKNAPAPSVQKFNPPIVTAIPEMVKSNQNLISQPKSDFGKLAEKHGIDVEEAVQEEEMTEEQGIRQGLRNQRVVNNSSNKQAVSQALKRPDNTPLFLASIEILDATGGVVKQTRTDAKGFWKAVLSEGTYTVHVIKKFPNDPLQENIDKSYSISIPSSAKPIILNAVKF